MRIKELLKRVPELHRPPDFVVAALKREDPFLLKVVLKVKNSVPLFLKHEQMLGSPLNIDGVVCEFERFPTLA